LTVPRVSIIERFYCTLNVKKDLFRTFPVPAWGHIKRLGGRRVTPDKMSV
jgi:hypothetical protein